MPLTEEPASQYDSKIHKSSYSELSGALGQCSVRGIFTGETRKETIIRSHFILTTSLSIVIQVPTNKPERDASALPAIPWDRIVDWAHRAPEITSLDDQMVSPAKRCMIPF